MKVSGRIGLLLLIAIAGIPPLQAADQELPAALVRQGGPQDFDFEIGKWKTQLKRLTNPLSGQAGKWVEYEGTTWSARSGTGARTWSSSTSRDPPATSRD